MAVRKIGEFYQTAMITGPRQNFLAVAVASGAPGAAPHVDVLPPIGDRGHGQLNRELVVRAVLEGVTSANRQFGTHYRVTAIRYVADDTPPETIYATLAQQIIAYLAERSGAEEATS